MSGYLSDLLPIRKILVDGVEQPFVRDLDLDSTLHASIDQTAGVLTLTAATKSSGLTLVNGANSDIAIGSGFARISGPTGAFSVSGFAQPLDANGAVIDGYRLTIFNTTAQVMTITNNATSTAANRITTLTGADVVLAARTTTASFIYDATTSRWILTAYT